MYCCSIVAANGAFWMPVRTDESFIVRSKVLVILFQQCPYGMLGKNLFGTGRNCIQKFQKTGVLYTVPAEPLKQTYQWKNTKIKQFICKKSTLMFISTVKDNIPLYNNENYKR